MSRKVIGVIGAIIGISLAAACGSEPKLEVSKTLTPNLGFGSANALNIKNLEEKEIRIKDIKFPKQDCNLKSDVAQALKEEKYSTLKYGQSRMYMYVCSSGVSLLHAEVYTTAGDMEYTWEE